MISTAVPPNGKFWYCCWFSQMKKKFGRTEIRPRYSAPGRVIRLRMKSS